MASYKICKIYRMLFSIVNYDSEILKGMIMAGREEV